MPIKEKEVRFRPAQNPSHFRHILLLFHSASTVEHSCFDSTHMFPALLQHQPAHFCTLWSLLCNQLERASKRWDENFSCSRAIRPKHPIKLHICTAIFCLLMESKSEQMHCREHGLSVKLILFIAYCPISMLASLPHLHNILLGTF